jgi:hypothetical protein
MASGRIHVCLATLFALGLGGAARSGADEVTINGLNVEKTITCDHRDVVIHGTNHRLTLKGRCRQVWVDGTGHLVHVEALGSADVAGVNNRIEWERALRGEEPDIEIIGVGNSAARVAGGSAPGRRGARTGRARITVQEDSLQRVYDCAGGSATVEGGENRLTLRRCLELRVTGAENRIVMEGPVRVIRLQGNDNTVEWSEGEGGRPPVIENPGSGNHVLRK